ncbi:hypothetical protein OSTOST_14365 [Ostertagia ostertagi]
MPAEATSLQKAEILCRQLANWDGSYCLTEASETSSNCEEAYEKLERSLKTVEKYGPLDERRSEFRYGPRTFDRRGGDRPKSGGMLESAPLVPKEKRERGPPRRYRCGIMGHLAKDCRDRPGLQQGTPTTDEYIERIPGPNTKVRDASGDIIEFLDTIRIEVKSEDQVEVVSVFVGRSPDEVVILVPMLWSCSNLRLLKNSEAKSAQMTSRANATVAKVEGQPRATTSKINKRRHAKVHNVAWKSYDGRCRYNPAWIDLPRLSSSYGYESCCCCSSQRRSYRLNRADMNDTINLAKSAAVLMKQELCSLIQQSSPRKNPRMVPALFQGIPQQNHTQERL